MYSIKDIIARFKIPVSPERIIKDCIVAYLVSKGIPISPLEIQLQHHCIRVTTEPYTKSYILMHQKDILIEIAQVLPKYTLSKIQ